MSTYPKVQLEDLTNSSAKGGYILILELDATKQINVGGLGTILFPQGSYAYLGSALGGFKSRINRHLNKGKKPKWHIDYLLNETEIIQIIIQETEGRLECILSQALANELASIPGFGCSDCRCESHLYFANYRPSLELAIRKAIARVTSPKERLRMLTYVERGTKNCLL